MVSWYFGRVCGNVVVVVIDGGGSEANSINVRESEWWVPRCLSLHVFLAHVQRSTRRFGWWVQNLPGVEAKSGAKAPTSK